MFRERSSAYGGADFGEDRELRASSEVVRSPQRCSESIEAIDAAIRKSMESRRSPRLHRSRAGRQRSASSAQRPSQRAVAKAGSEPLSLRGALPQQPATWNVQLVTPATPRLTRASAAGDRRHGHSVPAARLWCSVLAIVRVAPAAGAMASTSSQSGPVLPAMSASSRYATAHRSLPAEGDLRLLAILAMRRWQGSTSFVRPAVIAWSVRTIRESDVDLSADVGVVDRLVRTMATGSASDLPQLWRRLPLVSHALDPGHVDRTHLRQIRQSRPQTRGHATDESAERASDDLASSS